MESYTKKNIISKLEEGGLKSSSAKNYSAALVCIVNKLCDSDLNILKKPTDKWFNKKEFDSKFNHLKQNTIRNYISAVVSWMKVKKETDTKLFKELSNDRDEYNHYYERIIKGGEKTDYEKAMWVDPENIANVYKEKVFPFLDRLGFTSVRKNMSNSNNFDNSEMKKIRDYVILSVYLYPFYDKESNFGVIRNDVANLYLSNGKNIEEGKNYFIIGRGGYSLRMSDYKTQSAHGTITIPIPSPLGLILKKWCQFSNKEIGEKVFLGIDKHHVTEILQRNLKTLLGKGVGVQMLRKIYVSWRFGKKIEEEKEVAESMMHTLNTQQNVYAKK